MSNDKKQCPQFPYFGASYPDAVCIDGFLWDLDSCDEPGGPLYQGGDSPCPFCNPQSAYESTWNCLDYSDQEENETDEAFEQKTYKIIADNINKLRVYHGFEPFEFWKQILS